MRALRPSPSCPRSRGRVLDGWGRAQLRIPHIPDAANNRASRFISGAARRASLYRRSSTGKHEWKYMPLFHSLFRIIFFKRTKSYNSIPNSILIRDATVISVSLKFYLFICFNVTSRFNSSR